MSRKLEMMKDSQKDGNKWVQIFLKDGKLIFQKDGSQVHQPTKMICTNLVPCSNLTYCLKVLSGSG